MKTGNTTSRAMDDQGAAAALAEMADKSALLGYLTDAGLTPADDEPVHLAGAVLKAEGITTQGHFAAVVINFTHGEGKELHADSLTDALRRAFPDANVGKRHGPHYLCHARRGQLKGLREDLKPIPFVKRAKRKAEPQVDEAAEDEASVATDRGELTAQHLMDLHDRRTLQAMAKENGVSAGGKTEEIAQRIVDAMGADDSMVA